MQHGGVPLRALLLLIVVSCLVPLVDADAEAVTRSYFLYDDGSEMTTGEPTNEDPAGLTTLYLESEGRRYSARTAPLAHDLRIVSDDGFHLRLADRAAIDPVPAIYATEIALVLFNGPELVLANGQPYHLAREVALFAHPGGDVGDAHGWTDFTFDASATLPDDNHCTPAGCVRVDAHGLVIPAGLRVALAVGLASPSECALDLCAAGAAVAGETRHAYRAALDEVASYEIVDPYNPLGLSNFDPVNNTVDPPVRELAQGDRVEQLVAPTHAPRSMWRTASTTSDSRLDIRLA